MTDLFQKSIVVSLSLEYPEGFTSFVNPRVLLVSPTSGVPSRDLPSADVSLEIFSRTHTLFFGGLRSLLSGFLNVPS